MQSAHLDQLLAHAAAQAERTRDALRAAFQESDRGRKLQAARVLQIPTGAATGTPAALLWGAEGRLLGWTLRNSARVGTLVVNLYDGPDNGAALVATIDVAATPPAPATWFGPSGLSITEKLTAEIITTGGAVLAGAFYVGATD